MANLGHAETPGPPQRIGHQPRDQRTKYVRHSAAEEPIV